MRVNLSSLEPLFRERLLHSAERLGLVEAEDGVILKAEKSDKAAVKREGNNLIVYYSAPYEFFYGVKTYLSKPDSNKIDIESCFDEFGVMLDCSRNAVRTVESVKRFAENSPVLTEANIEK